MNSKMWLAFGSTVATLCAGAADYPKAGGDIADNSAAGWDGTMPGTSDEAKFTKAGTYTASDNVTFGSVNFAADGLVFDLTADKKTVTLKGSAPIVGPTAANVTTELRGGAWSATGMQFKSIGSGYTLLLSDGVTITDSGTFSPGYGLSGNLIKLTGGAKIKANDMRLHQWGSTNTKMDIGAGCEVHTTGALTGETNAGAGYGGHTIDVHGEGALLDVGGDLKTASVVTGNGVCVRDNANLKVGGVARLFTADCWLDVLNGATATVKSVEFTGDNGRLCVSNASFTASTIVQFGTSSTGAHGAVVDVRGARTSFSIPKINIGASATGASDGNAFLVRDGAQVSVPDTFFISSGNRMMVSNATYSATANFQLGYTAEATGNVATVTGSKAVFDRSTDVFGKGNKNRFELVDGASWQVGGNNVNFMDGTSRNVLRVTGGATLSNKSSPAGDKNFYLYGTDNRLEVTEGGTVDVERFFVYGVRNQIIVSNGTLKASSSAGYGIWMRGSEGTALIVRGTTPSVQLNEYKSSGGSAIRFEVPAGGYADGWIPVTASKLNPGSTVTEKFEIECSAWATNPNAIDKLVLMRCATDISEANAAWILAQNANLPENVKLKVKGGDVILYKPKGIILVVR